LFLTLLEINPNFARILFTGDVITSNDRDDNIDDDKNNRWEVVEVLLLTLALAGKRAGVGTKAI
jgi:hypothetical protein